MADDRSIQVFLTRELEVAGEAGLERQRGPAALTPARPVRTKPLASSAARCWSQAALGSAPMNRKRWRSAQPWSVPLARSRKIAAVRPSARSPSSATTSVPTCRSTLGQRPDALDQNPGVRLRAVAGPAARCGSGHDRSPHRVRLAVDDLEKGGGRRPPGGTGPAPNSAPHRDRNRRSPRSAPATRRVSGGSASRQSRRGRLTRQLAGSASPRAVDSVVGASPDFVEGACSWGVTPACRIAVNTGGLPR
jgi:hypothetical protein